MNSEGGGVLHREIVELRRQKAEADARLDRRTVLRGEADRLEAERERSRARATAVRERAEDRQRASL